MSHHFFLPISEACLPPKQTVVPAPARIGMVGQYPPPEILWLDTAESTHNLLKTPEYATLPSFRMVAARCQTAGRGQRGNSWESEDFMNLTFSMAVEPTWLHPAMQFALSEATALAVVAYLQSEGIDATVKWPNDIYVGDRKICGILIDHSIDSEKIIRSVVSAGLNINQTTFHSDAPNPVSMKQLLNRNTSVDSAAVSLLLLLRQFIIMTSTPEGRSTLHRSFMLRLYRNDGLPHPYHDQLRDIDIEATIEEVLPDGTLLLRDQADGITRPYLFKQVVALLTKNFRK